MIAELENRWKKLWQNVQVDVVPQHHFEKLIQAYSSADRFYHNLAHIHSCLSMFDRTKSLAVHPEEVELAIWFHDAVYDTRANDNEQKSAEWAERAIRQSGLSSNIADRVTRSILATRHTADIVESDAQLMVDVDLSILGASSDLFWQYEENIRKEYARVPERLFRRKRAEILNSFLNRQSIYYHAHYRQMFEERARLHLAQAIAKLSSVSDAASL